MSSANSISGSLDEATPFRQGISIVTIKDQLSGMLPKMSSGTRSKLIVDGNAPDSDVYFDDSMMGLGPGTIAPTLAEIKTPFFFVAEEDEFIDLWDIEDPGIFNIQLTGSYKGLVDGTVRIEIADPEDDDVFTLATGIFAANLSEGEVETDHLNDLTVLLEDDTETTDDGDEKILIASCSYDSSQGINIYRVEISSAEEGSADRIVWYKNNVLLTTANDGDVITTGNGNILVDGDNRIAVKFEYDGYDDVEYGAAQKHTVGDYWTIVAGTQQFRWKLASFDDSMGTTIEPISGSLIKSGGPFAIVQTEYQPLDDGIYVKFPSQVGYADGADPNVEANIWEFGVVSSKPEEAITAMQEALGKIQVFPDHRMEQRDFGQPKFHNDFDIATQKQQQIATVTIKDPIEIGKFPYAGTNHQLWMSTNGKFKDYSSYEIGFVPDETDIDGASIMSTDILGNRYWYGFVGAPIDDIAIFTVLEHPDFDGAETINDIDFDPYDDEDGWAQGNGYITSGLPESEWAQRHDWDPTNNKSIDGKVGPYFTIYSLHEKYKTEQLNHVWFNFGHTSTKHPEWTDDRDPSPNLSEGVAVDISGRELIDLHMSGSDELSERGRYEIYNTNVLNEIPYEQLIAGEAYWTNDAGATMVSAADITLLAFPASQNINDVNLWTITGATIKTASTAGFDPDIGEDTPTPMMSVNINGNTIYDELGAPTPLEEADWMELHGYSPAALSEVDWMIREGYLAMEDVLHDKYFVVYDERFVGYYVWFDVDDQGHDPDDYEDHDDPPDGILEWSLEPTIATYTNDDGEQKSIISPREIRVRLTRTDLASAVATKLVLRFNKSIPMAQLDGSHPFFIGSDTSEIFRAYEDDSDNHIVDLKLRNEGRVQKADYQLSGGEQTLPEDFQVFLSNSGGQGYRMAVLDNQSATKKVIQISKYMKLYNVSRYWYPVIRHDLLPFLVVDDKLWSDDFGATADTATGAGWDGIGTEEEWALANGYYAYAGVDANLPHYIWWNVNGITRNPAAPSYNSPTSGPYNYELWSYDLDDDDDAASLRLAYDNGRMLEVSISSKEINRTVAYKTAAAIVTQNFGQFSVPFVVKTPGNQNIVRVLQRDPGPVVPSDETVDNPIDNVTIIPGNAPVHIDIRLPGLLIAARRREYVCDSMVFGFEDNATVTSRFTATKRITEHYATYEINCVAEEKNGYLFDYSHQEWEDADPGMSTGWMRPGGTAEISNYEWSADKFAPGIIPQKTLGTSGLWKPSEISNVEKTALLAGFEANADPDGTANFDHMSVDSRGRKIYIVDYGAGDPDPSSALTAFSIGLEDDEMTDAGYVEHPLSEDEWMEFEEYIPVPAFTHKFAQASYIHLPHPDKNFYLWFDVAGLSADPGDDGAFDDILGLAGEELYQPQRLGGAVRIAIDSYDTAGVVAQKLADRINHDCFDVGKKFVLVGEDAEGDGIYQALNAGNLNLVFSAEISEEDSSIVRITCLKSGLVDLSVLEENDALTDDVFPETTSGDVMTFIVIDDGDTDFYVDIENTIAGTVLPPISDVSLPDVDAGLAVIIDESAYTPTQPGVTKVVSAFLPYEDMASYSRGFRRMLDDGTEIATAGPIAYIEDDTGSLIYPVIMSNVSMKDPDQYDGVIEPLEIRSRASRNTTDAYFSAHDVKGILLTDVAEDSRQRSNPIVQYIDKERTTFEPYEDGIEHMESSPAVESYTRSPSFSGIGINDMAVAGNYMGPTGSGMTEYSITVSDVGAIVNESIVYDKMKWKKNDDDWSDSIELDATGQAAQETVLTFEGLGGTNSIPTVGADPTGPDSSYSSNQEVEIPASAYTMRIDLFCKGDINQENEYYEVEWYDESINPDGSDAPIAWTKVSYATAGTVMQLNDKNHPEDTSSGGFREVDTRQGYDTIPHSFFDFDISKFQGRSSMLFRVWSSAFVDSNIAFKNGVKIVCTFDTLAAELKLDNGLSVIFEASYGHAAGDTWIFEAIARSHEDSVGSAVLPGYLTWQESKINPWKESSYHEEAAEDLADPLNITHYATGALIFNFNGYNGPIGDAGEDPDWDAVESWRDSDWEKEYLKTLNGQAFTLTDSADTSLRFEFDNDGILDNSGDEMISILRPESYIVRFPDADVEIQKRDTAGDLIWSDVDENIFSAYSTSDIPASTFGHSNLDLVDGTGAPMFEDMPEAEWAIEYSFNPVLVTATETAGDLNTPAGYAGKYFMVTTQTDIEQDNIINTIKGARYAVWFNVTELGEDGETVSLASAPTFDDLYRWTDDDGKTFTEASLAGTGWNPTGFTDYMTVNSSGETLWSYDNGETITTALIAGWTGYYNTTTFVDADDEEATGGTGVPQDGYAAWTEIEWAEAKSYKEVSLDEEGWHAYHNWDDYKDMVPILIEVVVNASDSIIRMMKKLVKTLRRFRNANQAKEFVVTYADPPSYQDFYDIFDGEDIPAGEDPDDWVVPDYDNEKLVKLDRDWWNIYDLDPDSPPVSKALARGWLRGWHTIRITSRNMGYHLVREYVDEDGNFDFDDIGTHEPNYYDISAGATADPTSGREFVFSRDIPGGHKQFKTLLEDTVNIINRSTLNISSSLRYSDELTSSPCGDQVEWTTSISIDYSIEANTDAEGFEYIRFPHDAGLFDHIFITGKTLAHKDSFPRTGEASAFVDGLCGIDLYQLTTGPAGNTPIEFHYYNDDYRGNIVTQDFHDGYDAGPYMSNTIISMGMSTHSSKPRHHKSSAAGMIFNDLPCGTDSITFGGWKK